MGWVVGGGCNVRARPLEKKKMEENMLLFNAGVINGGGGFLFLRSGSRSVGQSVGGPFDAKKIVGFRDHRSID